MPNNKCVGGETFNIIRNSNRQKLGGWACVWELKGFHITFIYSFIRYVSCCRWNCSPSLWLRLICLSLVTILSSFSSSSSGKGWFNTKRGGGRVFKEGKKVCGSKIVQFAMNGDFNGEWEEGREREREYRCSSPLYCVLLDKGKEWHWDLLLLWFI